MKQYGSKPGEKEFFSLEAFKAFINDIEVSV